MRTKKNCDHGIGKLNVWLVGLATQLWRPENSWRLLQRPKKSWAAAETAETEKLRAKDLLSSFYCARSVFQIKRSFLYLPFLSVFWLRKKLWAYLSNMIKDFFQYDSFVLITSLRICCWYFFCRQFFFFSVETRAAQQVD